MPRLLQTPAAEDKRLCRCRTHTRRTSTSTNPPDRNPQSPRHTPHRKNRRGKTTTGRTQINHRRRNQPLQKRGRHGIIHQLTPLPATLDVQPSLRHPRLIPDNHHARCPDTHGTSHHHRQQTPAPQHLRQLPPPRRQTRRSQKTLATNQKPQPQLLQKPTSQQPPEKDFRRINQQPIQ